MFLALDAPADILQGGVALASFAQTSLDGRDPLRQRDHVDLLPLDVSQFLADQGAFGVLLIHLRQAGDGALQRRDFLGQFLRAALE